MQRDWSPNIGPASPLILRHGLTKAASPPIIAAEGANAGRRS